MKSIFDSVSFTCSSKVTSAYSTSFSLAVKMLAPSVRPAIHSIYGFVRFADEIVDTFHEFDKEALLTKFENDFYEGMDAGISLNPILNSFIHTVKEYNIETELIDSFLASMRMDLNKKEYKTKEEYNEYIYGSADVVGLMCLKVFVNGDQEKFLELKESAMSLGSAFQKVNFLRDFKTDMQLLERSYFPNIDVQKINHHTKKEIIDEIERDFRLAYRGIVKLPNTSRFGVYSAYKYYKQLLRKIERTEPHQIMETRIRVSDHIKLGLLAKSYFDIKLNLV